MWGKNCSRINNNIFFSKFDVKTVNNKYRRFSISGEVAGLSLRFNKYLSLYIVLNLNQQKKMIQIILIILQIQKWLLKDDIL